MIGPTITVVDEGLRAMFTRAEKVINDARPELEKVGDEVFLAIRRRINSQAGYAPLSPRYAAQKARRFGAKPILRATDDLYGSFEKGAKDNVTRVTALEGEFGTSNPVGLFHQLGAGRLPKRLIIDMTDRDHGRFAKVAFDSFRERLKALGFTVR